MSDHYPSSCLSKVVTPVERPTSPLPGQIYRQLGVQLWGRGAYEREELEGSQTRYKTLSRVEAGDIVVNKIWARNGSVAVVSSELSGCYVSGEFPTFAPLPDKLEPAWFHWYSKTPALWRQCDEKSRGTSGKNRIRPEKFLEIEIPLPNIDEQRRIVSRIEELAAKAEEARILRSESTSRLSALVESRLSTTVANLSVRYGLKQISELITEANYGTSKKCAETRLTGAVPVLRIPNVASELTNRANLKYAVLSDSELRQVHLREGDVLVVRTNGSADLVGRCAVVPSLAEPTAFASYLIRLRVAPERALAAYLQLMLKHLRTNGSLIDFARTTAGQYNVSLGRLRTAQIPVPPLREQQEIVNQMRALEAEIAPLRSLQVQTAEELDALMPSILSRAFRGEL